ncbi:hypothetical protein CBR_g41269 [Chara braunii]|uniref:Remorin C-terminal domain-containing protein n=1 Tax=Chara braunii TaxID=69332 RepID=A0A388LVI9_CHABU|nr:hypothetical protein CBR_g41269 [Chara braunii]|eukprot:GBG86275.1 hypothetical protein CBR_g41269 [Chara braunii]
MQAITKLIGLGGDTPDSTYASLKIRKRAGRDEANGSYDGEESQVVVEVIQPENWPFAEAESSGVDRFARAEQEGEGGRASSSSGGGGGIAGSLNLRAMTNRLAPSPYARGPPPPGYVCSHHHNQLERGTPVAVRTHRSGGGGGGGVGVAPPYGTSARNSFRQTGRGGVLGDEEGSTEEEAESESSEGVDALTTPSVTGTDFHTPGNSLSPRSTVSQSDHSSFESTFYHRRSSSSLSNSSSAGGGGGGGGGVGYATAMAIGNADVSSSGIWRGESPWRGASSSFKRARGNDYSSTSSDIPPRSVPPSPSSSSETESAASFKSALSSGGVYRSSNTPSSTTSSLRDGGSSGRGGGDGEARGLFVKGDVAVRSGRPNVPRPSSTSGRRGRRDVVRDSATARSAMRDDDLSSDGDGRDRGGGGVDSGLHSGGRSVVRWGGGRQQQEEDPNLTLLLPTHNRLLRGGQSFGSTDEECRSADYDEEEDGDEDEYEVASSLQEDMQAVDSDLTDLHSGEQLSRRHHYHHHHHHESLLMDEQQEQRARFRPQPAGTTKGRKEEEGEEEEEEVKEFRQSGGGEAAVSRERPSSPNSVGGLPSVSSVSVSSEQISDVSLGLAAKDGATAVEGHNDQTKIVSELKVAGGLSTQQSMDCPAAERRGDTGDGGAVLSLSRDGGGERNEAWEKSRSSDGGKAAVGATWNDVVRQGGGGDKSAGGTEIEERKEEAEGYYKEEDAGTGWLGESLEREGWSRLGEVEEGRGDLHRSNTSNDDGGGAVGEEEVEGVGGGGGVGDGKAPGVTKTTESKKTPPPPPQNVEIEDGENGAGSCELMMMGGRSDMLNMQLMNHWGGDDEKAGTSNNARDGGAVPIAQAREKEGRKREREKRKSPLKEGAMAVAATAAVAAAAIGYNAPLVVTVGGVEAEPVGGNQGGARALRNTPLTNGFKFLRSSSGNRRRRTALAAAAGARAGEETRGEGGGAAAGGGGGGGEEDDGRGEIRPVNYEEEEESRGSGGSGAEPGVAQINQVDRGASGGGGRERGGRERGGRERGGRERGGRERGGRRGGEANEMEWGKKEYGGASNGGGDDGSDDDDDDDDEQEEDMSGDEGMETSLTKRRSSRSEGVKKRGDEGERDAVDAYGEGISPRKEGSMEQEEEEDEDEEMEGTKTLREMERITEVAEGGSGLHDDLVDEDGRNGEKESLSPRAIGNGRENAARCEEEEVVRDTHGGGVDEEDSARARRLESLDGAAAAAITAAGTASSAAAADVAAQIADEAADVAVRIGHDAAAGGTAACGVCGGNDNSAALRGEEDSQHGSPIVKKSPSPPPWMGEARTSKAVELDARDTCGLGGGSHVGTVQARSGFTAVGKGGEGGGGGGKETFHGARGAKAELLSSSSSLAAVASPASSSPPSMTAGIMTSPSSATTTKMSPSSRPAPTTSPPSSSSPAMPATTMSSPPVAPSTRPSSSSPAAATIMTSAAVPVIESPPTSGRISSSPSSLPALTPTRFVTAGSAPEIVEMSTGSTRGSEEVNAGMEGDNSSLVMLGRRITSGGNSSLGGSTESSFEVKRDAIRSEGGDMAVLEQQSLCSLQELGDDNLAYLEAAVNVRAGGEGVHRRGGGRKATTGESSFHSEQRKNGSFGEIVPQEETETIKGRGGRGGGMVDHRRRRALSTEEEEEGEEEEVGDVYGAADHRRRGLSHLPRGESKSGAYSGSLPPEVDRVSDWDASRTAPVAAADWRTTPTGGLTSQQQQNRKHYSASMAKGTTDTRGGRVGGGGGRGEGGGGSSSASRPHVGYVPVPMFSGSGGAFGGGTRYSPVIVDPVAVRTNILVSSAQLVPHPERQGAASTSTPAASAFAAETSARRGAPRDEDCRSSSTKPSSSAASSGGGSRLKALQQRQPLDEQEGKGLYRRRSSAGSREGSAAYTRHVARGAAFAHTPEMDEELDGISPDETARTPARDTDGHDVSKPPPSSRVDLHVRRAASNSTARMPPLVSDPSEDPCFPPNVTSTRALVAGSRSAAAAPAGSSFDCRRTTTTVSPASRDGVAVAESSVSNISLKAARIKEMLSTATPPVVREDSLDVPSSSAVGGEEPPAGRKYVVNSTGHEVVASGLGSGEAAIKMKSSGGGSGNVAGWVKARKAGAEGGGGKGSHKKVQDEIIAAQNGAGIAKKGGQDGWLVRSNSSAAVEWGYHSRSATASMAVAAKAVANAHRLPNNSAVSGTPEESVGTYTTTSTQSHSSDRSKSPIGNTAMVVGPTGNACPRRRTIASRSSSSSEGGNDGGGGRLPNGGEDRSLAIVALQGGGNLARSSSFSGPQDDSEHSKEHYDSSESAHFLYKARSKRIELQAHAYEEELRAKYLARYRRQEARALALEKQERAKAEADLRKIEVQIEKLKAKALEKLEKDYARARRKAEDRKAVAESKMMESLAVSRQKAEEIRTTGRVPRLIGKCFTKWWPFKISSLWRFGCFGCEA